MQFTAMQLAGDISDPHIRAVTYAQIATLEHEAGMDVSNTLSHAMEAANAEQNLKWKARAYCEMALAQQDSVSLLEAAEHCMLSIDSSMFDDRKHACVYVLLTKAKLDLEMDACLLEACKHACATSDSESLQGVASVAGNLHRFHIAEQVIEAIYDPLEQLYGYVNLAICELDCCDSVVHTMEKANLLLKRQNTVPSMVKGNCWIAIAERRIGTDPWERMNEVYKMTESIKSSDEQSLAQVQLAIAEGELGHVTQALQRTRAIQSRIDRNTAMKSIITVLAKQGQFATAHALCAEIDQQPYIDLSYKAIAVEQVRAAVLSEAIQDTFTGL